MCSRQEGYWCVCTQVCRGYLAVLVPGLEAARQGAMHEQLGDAEQLPLHAPLVGHLVRPCLESSAWQ